MALPLPAQAGILLVDGDTLALSPLVAGLGRAGFVVRSATSGAAALAAIKQHHIDVAVIEYRLPDVDGPHLVQRLKQLAPQLRVIYLTSGVTAAEAIEALKWGRALDMLCKPLSDLKQLEASINMALASRPPEPVTPPAAAPAPAGVSGLLEHLNTREQAILSLLGQGLDTRLIADMVGLGEKTVRNHLTVIYEKMGVVNRTQAAILAKELGLC